MIADIIAKRRVEKILAELLEKYKAENETGDDEDD